MFGINGLYLMVLGLFFNLSTAKNQPIMKYIISLFFTISLFAQEATHLDTLSLGGMTFQIEKTIQETSELRNYYQVDDSGLIIKQYTVEIYHDPMPYSSFFFQPAHGKGTFFPVTSLKDSDVEKRNMQEDSTYVANSINNLLLDDKKADDMLFEQQMKLSKKKPDCMNEIKAYAVGNFGGREFKIGGNFPNYGIQPVTNVNVHQVKNFNDGNYYAREDGLIIEVNNKCKILSVKNVRKFTQ